MEPRDGDEESLNYEMIFEQYVAGDQRGVLIVGEGRRVVGMNSAARGVLDYHGPLDRPLSLIVPDVYFGFAVGEALHDRRPVWHESYLPDPDRLLRFQLVPIMATTEEPLLVVATIEDITNVRHLETVRRDFVANVSHELRTPLASITLLVETLQRGALQDTQAAEHFLHRIEVETMAMARLVEELLDLSRLEKGVLSLRMERVCIAELVAEVLNRLQPTATDKGIQVLSSLQASLPPVLADPKRMEQVLINLVHNAIKFTPAPGSVTVHAVRKGRGVEIEVADTGMGMASAEAARIFERFYKVDKGRNRAEGAGLGLAIARHLLELHGSQLRVVSELGRGSRFFFGLPIYDESPQRHGLNATSD